jgi:hypothetical protein
MTTKIASPVSVSFPLFVRRALEKLPEFLTAIEVAYSDIIGIEFSPNQKDSLEFPDPEVGFVSFMLVGSQKITFFYRYRAGEEGTRGSLDHLERIDHVIGKEACTFYLLEHRCGCGLCPGIRYPFCPAGMVGKHPRFEDLSDEERLSIIREHIAS